MLDKLTIFILLICFATNVSSQSKTTILFDSLGYYATITPTGKLWSGYVTFKQVLHDPTGTTHYMTLNHNNKWGMADEKLLPLIPSEYDTIIPHKKFLFCFNLKGVDIYSRGYQKLFHLSGEKEVEIIPVNPYDSAKEQLFLFDDYMRTAVTTETFQIYDSLIFDDAFYLNGVILTRKGSLFGFISLSGKNIRPEYSSISFFNNQIISLKNSANETKYFYTTGVPFPHTDSVLQVVRKGYKIYQNGKGYLINASLEKIVDYTGDDVFPLNKSESENITKYFAYKKNNKIGICTNKGTIVVTEQFEYIESAGENGFIVMKDSLFGVIDLNGNWKIKPEYTFIEYPYPNYFRLHQGEKKALCNQHGTIILDLIYDEISPQQIGIVTLLGNKYGFYNSNGVLISPEIWDEVYLTNGDYIELVNTSKKNSALVNERGLITPTNCTAVFCTGTGVKYYLGNTIVFLTVENGMRKDSSVYQQEGILHIDRHRNRSPLYVITTPCITFRDQLSGKIGSKKKRDKGYAVEPQFDNLINHHIDIGKKEDKSTFYIGSMPFHSYETLFNFSGGSGDLSDPMLSVLSPTSTSQTPTHSRPIVQYDGSLSVIDPLFIQFDTAIFATTLNEYTAVYSSGDINFSKGFKTITVREYFNSLNTGFNLTIDNIQVFSILSTNNTIYLDKPEINLYHESFSRKTYLGKFKEFLIYPDGSIAVQNMQGNFYYMNKDEVNSKSFKDLKSILFVPNVINAYYFAKEEVSDIGGISEYKWFVYNELEKINTTGYDEIEFLGNNFIKTRNNNLHQIMTMRGEIVYTFTTIH